MTTAAPERPGDEWLAAAMSDEAVVAEFLLRLRHSSGESPPPRWGLRRPRSRPPPISAAAKEASSRRSPTTPLSWSGSDGIDDSGARSKGIGADEIASILSKRSRKKSFEELKDEESLLLKERVSLKKDISSLRATYQENRATNENLKKMKYDPNLLYPAKKLHTGYLDLQKAISGRCQIVSSTSFAAQPTQADHSQSSNHHEAGSSRDNPFLLPDLNMPPCEDDDSGFETLYGLS